MKLTGKTSLCRTCGRVFSTTENFDRHRRGKYDDPSPLYGRICLPVEQLPRWRLDKRGRWTQNEPFVARAARVEREIASTPYAGKGSASDDALQAVGLRH